MNVFGKVFEKYQGIKMNNLNLIFDAQKGLFANHLCVGMRVVHSCYGWHKSYAYMT